MIVQISYHNRCASQTNRKANYAVKKLKKIPEKVNQLNSIMKLLVPEHHNTTSKNCFDLAPKNFNGYP